MIKNIKFIFNIFKYMTTLFNNLFNFFMGNYNSINNKINFQDVQTHLHDNNYIIINTLNNFKQECLIEGTLPSLDEEFHINDMIKNNKNINIIIYGENCNDETTENIHLQEDISILREYPDFLHLLLFVLFNPNYQRRLQQNINNTSFEGGPESTNPYNVMIHRTAQLVGDVFTRTFY